MKITQCFLDMDGVLADFLGSVARLHGRQLPYDRPESRGVWNTEKLWGITAEEFWAPCDGPTFWDDLEKTEEADKLVSAVCQQFGEDNVAFLTAPSQSPHCVPGKRRWIERYYPRLKKNIIYGSAKKFLAAPNRLLIDDRDENVDNYISAGGPAILMPRMWNRRWERAHESLDVVLYKMKVLTSYESD